MRCHRLKKLIESNSELLRLDHQFLDLPAEQLRPLSSRSRPRRCHDGTDAGADLKQSVRHQVRYDLVRCVGVDLEFPAQMPDRGKRISGSQLPDDDRLFRRVHDLLADGNARPEVDSEGDQNACTIAQLFYNR